METNHDADKLLQMTTFWYSQETKVFCPHCYCDTQKLNSRNTCTYVMSLQFKTTKLVAVGSLHTPELFCVELYTTVLWESNQSVCSVLSLTVIRN